MITFSNGVFVSWCNQLMKISPEKKSCQRWQKCHHDKDYKGIFTPLSPAPQLILNLLPLQQNTACCLHMIHMHSQWASVIKWAQKQMDSARERERERELCLYQLWERACVLDLSAFLPPPWPKTLTADILDKQTKTCVCPLLNESYCWCVSQCCLLPSVGHVHLWVHVGESSAELPCVHVGTCVLRCLPDDEVHLSHCWLLQPVSSCFILRPRSANPSSTAAAFT